MNARMGTILITLAGGIAAFVLGPVIWPFVDGGTQPTGTEMLLLIVLSVIDSLLFGLGIAFLVYGWPLVQRLAGSGALACLAYLAIAFQLLSWWPHANLHRVVGDNFGALLAVDYGFHVPLQLGALAMALFFAAAARGALKTQREQRTAGEPVSSPATV